MFVDKSEHHREKVTQMVRFGGRRLVGILPHDSVNNSSVSDFQTVSVIGNCSRHLLHASGNADKCRGVIETSEVLKRPVDGAHLSVCEVDSQRVERIAAASHPADKNLELAVEDLLF